MYFLEYKKKAGMENFLKWKDLENDIKNAVPINL